jgi:hypothetical protein
MESESGECGQCADSIVALLPAIYLEKGAASDSVTAEYLLHRRNHVRCEGVG